MKVRVSALAFAMVLAFAAAPSLAEDDVSGVAAGTQAGTLSQAELDSQLAQVRQETRSLRDINTLRVEQLEREIERTADYIENLLLVFLIAGGITIFLVLNTIRHQSRVNTFRMRQLIRDSERALGEIERVVSNPQSGQFQVSHNLNRAMNYLREHETRLPQKYVSDVYAAAEDPHLPATLHYQANALKCEQDADWDGAIAYWEKLYMIDDSNSDVLLHLAQSYKNKADRDHGPESATMRDHSLRFFNLYTRSLRQVKRHLDDSMTTIGLKDKTALPAAEKTFSRPASSPAAPASPASFFARPKPKPAPAPAAPPPAPAIAKPAPASAPTLPAPAFAKPQITSPTPPPAPVSVKPQPVSTPAPAIAKPEPVPAPVFAKPAPAAPPPTPVSAKPAPAPAPKQLATPAESSAASEPLIITAPAAKKVPAASEAPEHTPKVDLQPLKEEPKPLIVDAPKLEPASKLSAALAPSSADQSASTQQTASKGNGSAKLPGALKVANVTQALASATKGSIKRVGSSVTALVGRMKPRHEAPSAEPEPVPEPARPKWSEIAPPKINYYRDEVKPAANGSANSQGQTTSSPPSSLQSGKQESDKKPAPAAVSTAGASSSAALSSTSNQSSSIAGSSSSSGQPLLKPAQEDLQPEQENEAKPKFVAPERKKVQSVKARPASKASKQAAARAQSNGSAQVAKPQPEPASGSSETPRKISIPAIEKFNEHMKAAEALVRKYAGADNRVKQRKFLKGAIEEFSNASEHSGSISLYRQWGLSLIELADLFSAKKAQKLILTAIEKLNKGDEMKPGALAPELALAHALASQESECRQVLKRCIEQDHAGLAEHLEHSGFDSYRSADWFVSIKDKATA